MATAQTAPVQAPTRSQEELARNVCDSFPWLPCDVVAEIPVLRFTVGDLYKLRAGLVVQTAFAVTNDIPLRVNNVAFGMGQFEMVESRIGIRITEFV